MIHVAYRLWGGDGFYAKMLGTSMLSMFENTKEKVTVHIMHNDRLTPDNRGKFCYIAGQYNQQVDFRNVEEIAGDTLRKFEAVHPIPSGVNASWYPLIVHEVFPDLDKLIFLGADTIFNLDIGELWAYDLDSSGYGFAAVHERAAKALVRIVQIHLVEYENYFNADVLLLKPQFFRDNFELILNACKFIYDNGHKYCEQDALNYVFSEKYLKLPSRFNYAVGYTYSMPPKLRHIEKVIYHYAGGAKPTLNTDDIFNRQYFNYFLKTPWANADMFGNIDKALDKTFRELQNESRENLLHFTNLLRKRQRMFLIDEDFLDAAKQILEIEENERVMELPVEAEKLVEELNAAKGKAILFLLIKDYPQARNFLVNQGFVEGVDFANGFMFLSERHGLNLGFDSRPILQEM